MRRARIHIPSVFTFAELKTATENFCIASKIGEGVFGSVYKGVIKSLDLDHPIYAGGCEAHQ
ncbi:putative non-specific serine/threonine protein kinase [Helianthus annuus]|nr:putative non-specific serine/threonine protein kinase [Helianthus annuus]